MNTKFNEINHLINNNFRNISNDTLVEVYEKLKESCLQNSDISLLGMYTYESISIFLKYGKKDMIIYLGLSYMSMNLHFPDILKSGYYHAISGEVDAVVQDYAKAKQQFIMSQELFDKVADEIMSARCACRMAQLMLLERDFNSIIPLLHNAQCHLNEVGKGDDSIFYESLAILAETYLHLEELSSAKEFLDKMLNWNNIDQENLLRYKLYFLYGRYYELKMDFENALIYFQEAEEIIEDVAWIGETEQLFEEISKLYKKMEQHDQAYLYLKKKMGLLKNMITNNSHLLKQNYELEFMKINYENDLRNMKEIDYEEDASVGYKYDSLTSGYGKVYLEELLERQIKLLNQSAVDVGLMIIDLQHLKNLDQSKDMDKWLTWSKKVVKHLLESSISHQYVARMNSHKILVTFHSVAGDSGVKQARKMIDGLKEMAYKEHIELGLSAGYVQYKKAKAKSIEDLYRLADMSLYQSKHLGQESLTIW